MWQKSVLILRPSDVQDVLVQTLPRTWRILSASACRVYQALAARVISNPAMWKERHVARSTYARRGPTGCRSCSGEGLNFIPPCCRRKWRTYAALLLGTLRFS